MYFKFQSRLCNIGCRSNFSLLCVTSFFSSAFQRFLYNIYLFHEWQWKGVLFMCTHSTLQTPNWQFEKVQVEQSHPLCQSQVLLIDPIAYVCTLMLSQFSRSWNHLPALGAYNAAPRVFKSEYLNYQTENRWYWLSGAVFVYHMFLVFLFYERVHNICLSVIWNIVIFHFFNEKLLKYSFMLDIFDELEIR